MPFDSEPAAEVTARDRMVRLRDFLAVLPATRFNMRYLVSRGGQAECADPLTDCGTAACIAGYALAMFFDNTDDAGAVQVADCLGLTREQGDVLFLPHYHGGPPASEYTVEWAVRTLDHYLATLDATGVGIIDWSVAADQPAKREPEPAR